MPEIGPCQARISDGGRTNLLWDSCLGRHAAVREDPNQYNWTGIKTI